MGHYILLDKGVHACSAMTIEMRVAGSGFTLRTLAWCISNAAAVHAANSWPPRLRSRSSHAQTHVHAHSHANTPSWMFRFCSSTAHQVSRGFQAQYGRQGASDEQNVASRLPSHAHGVLTIRFIAMLLVTEPASEFAEGT